VHVPHLVFGGSAVTGVVDHVVGQTRLLGERHLAADPGQRLLARATVAADEPPDLRRLVGDDDHQPIHVLVVAALDHHRGIEHDDTTKARPGQVDQRSVEPLPDPGMRQGLEPAPAIGAGEDDGAERLAVEAAVGAYAQKFGEDEELWRVTALLHDFDYEMHPTLDKHPQDGAPILREEGYPENVVETVLSHAEHLGLPRDTPLKKALFACDELSGFVHACALVRPTGLEGLEPKSVKKKLKQPSFAAGVHREDVYKGAEELGVDLDDHIRTVVAALQPIASELGLPG